MNNNIIIHIGLHKTASSYMQVNIYPNLSDTLFIYGASKFINQWNAQVYDAKTNLLISHEGLSGMPWDRNGLLGIDSSHDWLESFEKNVNTLKHFFPEAEIVIFFRKHGDLLISLFKQYLYEGGILNLSDFYGEGKVIQPKDLSFKYRIDLLNKLFDDVYLLDFEDFKKMGDDYLELFFQKEFSLNLENSENTPTKKNKGISGNKLEALRKVNTYYNDAPDTLKKILRRLGLFPRHFFQNRMGYWRAKESMAHIKKKKEMNNEFIEDWKYVESMKYGYSIE